MHWEGTEYFNWLETVVINLLSFILSDTYCAQILHYV